jgi:chaperonin GroES
MNTSGIQPLDLRVLVLPDPVEERSAGGILLPEQHKEREKFATVKGTLIAVGENAWEEAAARSASFIPPVAGDRVVIAKYGGIMLTGDDGKDYRLLNDEDVIGLLIGEKP